MEGLAQTMAQPAQPSMQGAMPTVDQIVALLMQGIDPQKLVEQGIPSEMVMEAIALLEQQMAAQQAPEQGLAAQSAGGMM